MHPSLLVAALAVFPLTSALRLPSHYTRRCPNGTNNGPRPDAAPVPGSKCDLSKVTQPANTLNPPTGLTLVLIAHGQGTQNYTCGTNLTSAPTSIGALAKLSDASCSAAGTPRAASDALGSITEGASIGMHFFLDSTTPDFDVIGLGNTATKKLQDCPAPGKNDVKWLRLEAQQQGSTSRVKMIYRLNTKGGLSPANCEGRAPGEVVTVGYEAEYWMYSNSSAEPLADEDPAKQPEQPPLETTTNSAVIVTGVPSASVALGLVALYVYILLW